MREVTRVQTADGAVHKDHAAAISHIKRGIDTLLIEIGDTLGQQKPMYIAGWVEENLHKFLALKALKEDLKMEHLRGEDD